MAKEAEAALADRNLPIQVAVMGCVVNGPGEAKMADLGIAAGRGRGHLFVKGKIVRVVAEADMVSALVDEAEQLVAEGVEARLAAADEGAEAEAELDRQALLQIQGDDPNAVSSGCELIRKRPLPRPAGSTQRGRLPRSASTQFVGRAAGRGEAPLPDLEPAAGPRPLAQ